MWGYLLEVIEVYGVLRGRGLYFFIYLRVVGFFVLGGFVGEVFLEARRESFFLGKRKKCFSVFFGFGGDIIDGEFWDSFFFGDNSNRRRIGFR